MSLKTWLRSGWLAEQETDPEEIKDLLAIAERDLRSCQVEDLDTDNKFCIAYNAALQVATAALAVAGYRASRDSHHYRVIHSLEFTMGVESAQVDLFDEFRKKRNIGEYIRPGQISELEANEMISLAEGLRMKLLEWLRNNFPRLI
jgi:uncharacterized protein (UPF0332 family)